MFDFPGNIGFCNDEPRHEKGYLFGIGQSHYGVPLQIILNEYLGDGLFLGIMMLTSISEWWRAYPIGRYALGDELHHFSACMLAPPTQRTA